MAYFEKFKKEKMRGGSMNTENKRIGLKNAKRMILYISNAYVWFY